MSPAVEYIVAYLDSLKADGFTQDERFKVKEAAQACLNRLQTPFERVWSWGWEIPMLQAACQIFRDVGLWTAWTANEGGDKSLEELCELSNKDIEASLVRRLMKHLGAFGVVKEVEVDRWCPAKLSLALGDDSTDIGQLLQSGTDHSISQANQFAAFLSKTNYREPLDNTKHNYEDLCGIDFFAKCAASRSHQESFTGLMSAITQAKRDWTDVYDTNQLLHDADLSSPIFVDQGASHGLDCRRLLAKHPDLPASSIIMQDLGHVLDLVTDLPPPIQKMAHDFFTPNPVIGAKAYFMHAVPHDWPDAQCRRIFENLVPAFKKGYSKLLLYEVVIPTQSASTMQTTLDMAVMNVLAAKERNEDDWKNLLGQSGFEIIKIWRHPAAAESVIEAELI